MYQSIEKMKLMMEAVQCTSQMRSRTIRCPNCGHKAFQVFEGATGYIETKCKTCKQVITINLVSMRRVRNAS